MKKMKYFLAALYLSIKNRRPEGTPYLNLCLGITGALLLNIAAILVALKFWVHINLISESKTIYLVCFLSLAIFILLLVKTIFPLDIIESIEVDPKSIKKARLLFILYYMLSLALIMILMFPSIKR